MTATLPVDIPYAKAVDWLVERRIVNASWQKTLRTAHAKLTAALESERPPVSTIDAILPVDCTQQATTYFDCVKVLAALKEAGLDEKSFLGAYTNAHTARWAEVVKKYESGAVYLVDAAQSLVQGCAYELPALKKEISRAERELVELQRRQAEYTRLAEASRTRFVQACSKRQIAMEESAAGLKDELRLSIAQLRPLYDKLTRRVQAAPFPAAVSEYKQVVTYALDKVEVPSGECGDPSALLPLVTRVQLIDLSLVDPSSMAVGGGGGGGGGGGAIEVDWGGGGNDASGGVDWGIESSGGGGGGVDWGIEADDGGAAGSGGVAEVSWDISADDGGGGAAIDLSSFDLEVEESGEDVGAEEQSLASVFEQTSTRNQFLDVRPARASFSRALSSLLPSSDVCAAWLCAPMHVFVHPPRVFACGRTSSSSKPFSHNTARSLAREAASRLCSPRFSSIARRSRRVSMQSTMQSRPSIRSTRAICCCSPQVTST